MKRHPLSVALAALFVLLASAALRPAVPAPTPLEKKVKAATDKLTAELIAIRQDIHCHPELGLQETRTSGIVAEYFRKLGLEVRTGYANTGVIGILKGGKPGPIVAMRGDMDAQPITEETGLPFASKEKAVVDKFDALGAESRGSTPEEFAGYLRKEYDTWAPVIRAAKIKAD